MIRGRRVLAVVPARAGSKGVPGKNLRPLGGRPLISWTIEAALGAPSVDRVVVSTDSKEIGFVARQLGAEVPFIRPDELATDHATAAAVLRHALLALADPAELAVYLQPTSPLRTSADIEACLDLATISGDRAVVTVRPAVDPPEWMYRVVGDGRLERVMGGKVPPRRQETQPAYVLNGAVYVSPVRSFLSTGEFVDETTAAFIMPSDRSIDIDEHIDLEAAERLANSGKRA